MASRAESFDLGRTALEEALSGAPPGEELARAIGGPGPRAAVLADQALGSYIGEIGEAEAAARGSALPDLPFGLFRRFDETGDRSAYETPYFERRRRLVALGLASWLRGGSGRASALEDLIWSICSEYSWALPAHLEGTCLDPACLPGAGSAGGCGPSGRPDSEAFGRPGPWPHDRYLDLFSCETGFALAEIGRLLGPSLTPIVLRRIETEVERRVLRPFVERAGPWRWELMLNNWCAVCAGSVAAAALYLRKDAAGRSEILARALPTLDRFLDSFSAEGVCLEGLGYWTYGFGFFAAAAELLGLASGGRIELFADGRARRAAAFQAAAYLDDRTALSFADGAAGERFRRGLSACLARKYPEARRPAPGLTAPFGHDPCGRWALSFRDLVWTAGPPAALQTDGGASEPMPAAPSAAPGGAAPDGAAPDGAAPRTPSWFPEAQWLICPSAGPGRLAFAAKGGHNDEPHNHNDLGSFVLVLDGTELIADLGPGEYTRDYFGAARYSTFCASSLGHSLPIVDGAGQAPGAERRAKVLDCRLEGRRAELSLELAEAYALPGLASLVRRFVFDGGSRLLLEDSFVFGGPAHGIVERFVTRAPWGLAAEGLEAPAPGGPEPRLRLTCRAPGAVPRRGIHPHREHDGREASITSLDYGFRCEGGTCVFGIEFALV